MSSTDPRVDAYIEQAKPFARPILEHLRRLIHTACPDVQETIKWGFPHFDYQGPVCHIASFKEHCAFGFWKAPLMKDAAALFVDKENKMSIFGRITDLADLPAEKILINYLKEAIDLNVAGIKLPPKKTGKAATAAEIEAPGYLVKALSVDVDVITVWKAFAPSQRKEYIEWITDAKTEATRAKRIEQTIEWLREGKQRNWKYQK